jgi:2-methylcitrate dehydratase PrpD
MSFPELCPFANHSTHMANYEPSAELAEADEAIRAALSLARAQEARVKQMRAAGLQTGEAEALLAAYRHGVHLAIRRKSSLEGPLRRNSHSRRDLF